jgi:hypothetical protein
MQKQFCDKWKKYSSYYDNAVSLVVAPDMERPLLETVERLYSHCPLWILVVTHNFWDSFYLTSHLKLPYVERWYFICKNSSDSGGHKDPVGVLPELC